MEFSENQQLITSIRILTSPSLLPTLPFDVIPEILCRLPVKLLLQLRCLSKSFNSLISDPKFAKKHLLLSKKRHHLLMLSYYKDKAVYDSPVTSVFSAYTVPQTQISYHNSLANNLGSMTALCSCDGIFCVTNGNKSVILWNPSLRKHKILPPLDMPGFMCGVKFGFGYDRVIDNYKTIAVSNKNEVSVNVLGTDYWRKMLDFPRDLYFIGSGNFVTGTVNWRACNMGLSPLFIISLDLEKESYQKIPKPDLEMDSWNLGVVKDCLCICAKSEMFLDVWIMKEYGNKESWTKLYSVPNMRPRNLFAPTALYISEDDQLLLYFNDRVMLKHELVVYDSKNGTLNIPEFRNKKENNSCLRNPQVYIESLISP